MVRISFSLLLVVFALGCGSQLRRNVRNNPEELGPPPELKVITTASGARFEEERGDTVVEPEGPWYGVARVCDVVTAWNLGAQEAQNQGVSLLLEDAQLKGRASYVLAQEGAKLSEGCRAVLQTMGARYPERMLTEILKATQIGSEENQWGHKIRRVPVAVFQALRKAEAICRNLEDKVCLNDQFAYALHSDAYSKMPPDRN